MAGASARQQLLPAPSTAATTTVILEPPPSSSQQQPQITDSLVLKLKRPQKKRNLLTIDKKEDTESADASVKEGDDAGCCLDAFEHWESRNFVDITMQKHT
ncbi:hypothetical protein BUALT_Bualt01G0003400 [Buddleja alternifolia]|uniref:Uncharacterized protein n=1 Tax=Buddleja alternifolia TaxID=168488 RepID=A0AAV6YAC1_9LAMI|nr:hypothetical protein BUALT_Bualt01G0003400 [Buddleja alternifolia]